MLVEVSEYVPGEFQDYSLVQMLPDLQKSNIRNSGFIISRNTSLKISRHCSSLMLSEWMPNSQNKWGSLIVVDL